MKVRHAVVLALIVLCACSLCACSGNTNETTEIKGNCYLMVPPMVGNSFDINAPLSKWLVSGTFDSVSECTSAQAKHIKEYQDNSVQVAANVAELGARVFMAARCVATDDPHLKD